MYEFDSVSVSSFEAASLAAKLTEKSADGWDVVAIVPAGTDVVAYLRRATAADADASADDGADADRRRHERHADRRRRPPTRPPSC